jgi:hypothetical protein
LSQIHQSQDEIQRGIPPTEQQHYAKGAEDDLAGINAEIGGITGNTPEDRDKDKEKKNIEMRRRVLSQVKGIERVKRGRHSSVCSVRSIYSVVGTVRAKSETEDEAVIKNPRIQSSLLPLFKQKQWSSEMILKIVL